ncbi:MAG: methylated-DNA--[protein]-cysteine S-methyltransferase [Actinobacteria bacterium]|uniref:methylated-DNA--[protein]-cysteine S-methyltransferase n=1 Tax=freshwater metagenome TaxID=449393 RepID=A0A6J7A4T5_9ZZZZ|nr:methylated-DNA--[protein]-cysteine S-methyltransferase [Actinomycetota bacterium]
MTTYTATVVSPVGSLTLVATGDALCELSWAGDKLATRGSLAANSVPDALHPVLARAMRELEEYFAGERRSFGVPVIAAGTGFQQSAWGVLRQIPYGETITYGEQARRVGNPRAVRAVGGANGRNPVGIIVPCHRVIGADGSLTGFGGGVDVKAWLLAHERQVAAG